MHLFCVDLQYAVYNKNVKEETLLIILLIIVLVGCFVDSNLLLGLLNVGLGFLIGLAISVVIFAWTLKTLTGML